MLNEKFQLPQAVAERYLNLAAHNPVENIEFTGEVVFETYPYKDREAFQNLTAEEVARIPNFWSSQQVLVSEVSLRQG